MTTSKRRHWCHGSLSTTGKEKIWKSRFSLFIMIWHTFHKNVSFLTFSEKRISGYQGFKGFCALSEKAVLLYVFDRFWLDSLPGFLRDKEPWHQCHLLEVVIPFFKLCFLKITRANFFLLLYNIRSTTVHEHPLSITYYY